MNNTENTYEHYTTYSRIQSKSTLVYETIATSEQEANILLQWMLKHPQQGQIGITSMSIYFRNNLKF